MWTRERGSMTKDRKREVTPKLNLYVVIIQCNSLNSIKFTLVPKLAQNRCINHKKLNNSCNSNENCFGFSQTVNIDKEE